MPIRMIPDNPGGGQRRSSPTPRRSSGGAGMGGGLGSLLPMLLGMLFKKPKLLLLVLEWLLWYTRIAFQLRSF